jgi:hypothetical protein
VQDYVMRIYSRELGGHTHLRIFTGKLGALFCDACKSLNIQCYENAGGLKMYSCGACGWHHEESTLQRQDSTLGKAGELTLTNEEFAAWRENRIKIEMIDFVPPHPSTLPCCEASVEDESKHSNDCPKFQ